VLRAILVSGGLALCQSVWAGPSVSVAVLTKDFQYTEFAEDGRVLDRERGTLPGVGYGLGYRAPGVEVGLDVARFAALIDYEGHTQSGASYSTQSDAVMWDVGVTLRLHLMPDRHLFTLGMNDASWERDILPAGGVLRLYEFYRWRTTRLGYEYRYQQGAHQLQLGIEYLKKTNGSMEVNFAGINPTTIPLKNGAGWAGGLQYAFTLDKQWRVTANYHTEAWSSGRSADVLVDSDYGPLKIHEPKNNTIKSIFGLAVSYRY